MTVINATNARQNLYQLISDVNTNSEPITIMNNRGKNAVLISEDDWRAIQETIYLNNIPGLAESIIEGGEEAIEECEVYSEDEEW
ncbi:MAG TPA: type II toxin-antitoxin system Phd/YefM family antitoxin [Thermoclostridium sp.]|nr:type II toxin-antitoxin system Phd/YefM family antitoxin [Thermoclostridium sp.]